jgi:hypothetical protein
MQQQQEQMGNVEVGVMLVQELSRKVKQQLRKQGELLVQSVARMAAKQHLSLVLLPLVVIMVGMGQLGSW